MLLIKVGSHVSKSSKNHQKSLKIFTQKSQKFHKFSQIF
jgi:hypothetical protein